MERRSWLSTLALPCWARILLALAMAGFVGLSALPAGANELPPGHPPIGDGMPAGHPPIDGGGAADDATAALIDQAVARAEQAGQPIDRAFVVSLVGEPADAPPATPEALEEKTHAIAAVLRCPVCQGSAVADSPSSTAINMKNEVRDLVALGFSRDQVLRYFEASYGQFVLMEPKAEGLGWLVWLLPGVLFVGGLAWVMTKVRQMGAASAPQADEPVPTRGQLPEDPDLAHWVRQVRELAYGWPGGEPPAKGEG